MSTYLVQDLVSLNADEVAKVVKMHLPELSTLVKFCAEFAADFHNGFEHLVVAVASEKDLAGVKLIKCTSDGPHVDCVIIWHTKYDLRRSIETTDQVWCDLIVCCCSIRLIDGRAQVTNLENVACFVNLYI